MPTAIKDGGSGPSSDLAFSFDYSLVAENLQAFPIMPSGDFQYRYPHGFSLTDERSNEDHIG